MAANNRFALFRKNCIFPGFTGFGNTEDGKDMVCKGGDVGDNGGMTCGAEVSIDV